MKSRLVSVGLILAILLSMMVGARFTTPAKAQGPIYLDSDYTLMSNHNFADDGFIITGDSITLDLNGYNVTGSGTGTAILNVGWDDLAIKNYGDNASFIRNFEKGIEIVPFVDGATYDWPVDCVVGWSSPWLLNALTNYQVPWIIVADNDIGMHVWYGGLLEGMPTVASVGCKSNTYGLLVDGAMCMFASTMSDNECGIYGEDFDGAIAFSFADFNSVGMHFLNSNPFIWANKIRSNTDIGLLMNSSSVQLPWIEVWVNNKFVGAFNVHEWWNLMKENEIGVTLANSSENIICNWGMINNTIGLDMIDSNSNLFYHNNFINNTNQVRIQNCVDTTWDSGYPLGGNHWSNYTGVDMYRGPYQNETGIDGIGDTPHIIDASNQDDYPLMTKYFPGDLNHDEIIDIFDLVILALGYGALWGGGKYDPRADLNIDGVIDIFDLVLMAAHYGKEDCMGED